jgi:DNA-binding PucR family transcriptional regulator
MKGLLLRLATLDADAETCVRVIAYFDALVERRASPEALVRATSGVAECCSGLQLGDDRMWRFSPGGDALSKDASNATVRTEFDINGTPACLWLERPRQPAPLDDLVLERASLAARMLLGAVAGRQAAILADPALVEMVLSSHAEIADRSAALRRLGLDPQRPIQVAAVFADIEDRPIAELVAHISTLCPARAVFAEVIGGIAAVLVQHHGASPLNADGLRNSLRGRTSHQRLRIGLGRVVEPTAAHSSWQQARLALRLASAAEHFHVGDDSGADVTDYDELGVLALLAEIPAERLLQAPDLVALEALHATEHGADDIATLEAYFREGSLRQTANALYLHHSTVSARLSRIEEALNWHLDDPTGRFRAQFALWSHRLVHAPTSE